jgi:hypothetical protein
MNGHPRAKYEWTLWVVAVSCLLHAAEEYLTGWQQWASESLGIAVPSGRFLAANAVLVTAAFLFAAVGWRRPALSLLIPSATLVNAIVFHILPTVLQGRPAPGVYTALFLYVPFSSWALAGAVRDGVDRKEITTAMIGGALLMTTIVLAAKLASRPG